MESEIAKSKALSKEETKALLALIERSKIITSKTTNAANNKHKNDEWNLLAERFNSTITSCPRTPQQLPALISLVIPVCSYIKNMKHDVVVCCASLYRMTLR
ncbi:hypothetical protein ACJJTC_008998 [Scirpophaga incertulas]